MNIWRTLVPAMALKTKGFMLLSGLLGFVGEVNMSKSELDQSELIKMAAKALAK